MKKKVLFICKYNRFRSKIAEARLKKINDSVSVRSRGIIEGRMNRNKHETEIPLRFGLKIKTQPNGVKYSDLEWAEYVVITANNVPKELFKSHRLKYKIIQWDIDDVYPDTPIREIEKVVEKVIKNTNAFSEKIGC